MKNSFPQNFIDNTLKDRKIQNHAFLGFPTLAKASGHRQTPMPPK
jgi:hypothetical protein